MHIKAVIDVPRGGEAGSLKLFSLREQMTYLSVSFAWWD